MKVECARPALISGLRRSDGNWNKRCRAGSGPASPGDNVRQTSRVPVLLAGDMARSLPVTAFATDTCLKKRRFCKTVLSSLDRLDLAGVAFQAADFDGAGKMNMVVQLKSWRDIPFACLGEVGDRRLEQVASQHGDVTAACRTRTDE